MNILIRYVMDHVVRSGSERSMKCVINMQVSFQFASQTHPFDLPNIVMAGKAIVDRIPWIPTKKEFSGLPTSMKYVGRCGRISDHPMLTTHPHILIAVINHKTTGGIYCAH